MQYRKDIVTRMPITRMKLITIINGNHAKYIWHNSAADFGVLENFQRKFANHVAPPTDGTTKCLVHFKVHPDL